MDKITKTKELVKYILEKCPETRDCDYLLWRKVILSYSFDAKGACVAALPVLDFLANVNKFGVPPFGTVARCRRKVQEQHPELLGTKRVRRKRKEKEEKFKEFARNG